MLLTLCEFDANLEVVESAPGTFRFVGLDHFDASLAESLRKRKTLEGRRNEASFGCHTTSESASAALERTRLRRRCKPGLGKSLSKPFE